MNSMTLHGYSAHTRPFSRVKKSAYKRILTKHSLRILSLYKHWLEQSSPLVRLRPRPLWSGFAAADAFANSDVCGIGGFIRTASNQCFWFSVCQTRFYCSSLFRSPSTTVCKKSFLHWSSWHRLLSYLR